jgi:hypothetical protein
MALQDGGWPTGRQRFTIKKLTVRKPNLWPQNRLSGIDLGSGKDMRREMGIANRNVELCANRYLINAKLQIGKTVKKRADWEKSIKAVKVRNGGGIRR